MKSYNGPLLLVPVQSQDIQNLDFLAYVGKRDFKMNFSTCSSHSEMGFDFRLLMCDRFRSDRSLHSEEQKKKKFVKNCPQWGLKPGPLDLQANALPTELGRNLLDSRFLKRTLFVSCTTSHVGLCSFLESIEYDFINAMKWHKLQKSKVGNRMLT